ncbi:MAG: hypothetical protein AVDCRST_MAG48-3427, partial [uncultured Friedmanniella sp.]
WSAQRRRIMRLRYSTRMSSVMASQVSAAWCGTGTTSSAATARCGRVRRSSGWCRTPTGRRWRRSSTTGA